MSEHTKGSTVYVNALLASLNTRQYLQPRSDIVIDLSSQPLSLQSVGQESAGGIGFSGAHIATPPHGPSFLNAVAHTRDTFDVTVNLICLYFIPLRVNQFNF